MNAASEKNHRIGIDLGATKILVKMFDGSFRDVSKARKKTKGFEGTESVVGRIIDAMGSALKEAGVGPQQLAAIGVGVPGPVDQQRGVVLEAVNLGWKNVPLGKLLRKEFGCPVVISNDVDAGVYGEYRFGAAKGARTTIGVFPGTGIGGGGVYDGQMIRGKGISCMEIGHVKVGGGARLCGCGARGCLESEASRLAISADAAAAAYRGEAPALLKAAGTDLSDIRSGVLAKAIQDGDQVVEDIVRRAAQMVGEAIANFVHLLAPDCVVLGGGLVEAMPKLYVSEVTKGARRQLMDSFVDTFRVVAAELGDDASVLGAAAWAEESTRSIAENSN